jgi:hypothetical protein
VRAAALTIFIAVALRLALGPGAIGYDAAWGLEWGRELAAGSSPSFETPGAPTPHPLVNVLSVPVSWLGDDAGTAVMAIAWLSLAALALAAFALGRLSFSPWVGAAFALLLVTRGLLVRETQQAIVDVPFLALVTAALVAELRHPRLGLHVPLLLFAAGLLRPEAWLLGAAWLVWAAQGRPLRALVAPALVIAAAPFLWCLQDLAVTGDPLYSLNGTRELAADLGRPTEFDTALARIPGYLRFTLTEPVFWVGLAGAAAALVWQPDRARLPFAVLGLGLAGFLVLGAAGLPLLIRYLLLPAEMLVLFAAGLALGWTALARGDRQRRWWLGAGVVASAVLVATTPGHGGRLGDLRALSDPRIAAYDDLRALAASPAMRAAVAACGPLSVPDARPRPLLAAWLERDPSSLPLQRAGSLRGLVLAYATAEAERAFRLGDPPLEPGRLPPGTRTVTRNGSWLLGTRC